LLAIAYNKTTSLSNKKVRYNERMKPLGEFLRGKREARGMSLREAAKTAGISHVHIRDIEEGAKSPSFDKVMKLLQAYMVDTNEFLRETGHLPQNVEPLKTESLYKIPLISWVIAEKLDDARYSLQYGDSEEWIASDVGGHDVFALKVIDDSMQPEFNEGDIIIVSPHEIPDHDDYVIIKDIEGATVFRQLKRYGKTRVLHPLNLKYPDMEFSRRHQFKIVGKVVEKKKKY
jgi:SOS-response transcriptional repressor LexA